jgi:hypothetical protein
VVRLSTSCIKVSRKVLLSDLECVGRSNSAKMSSMVSRINKTSVSDTCFSGKVGSAGCVDFPVLQNVSQNAMHLIVGVVFYEVTANHHH